MSLRKKIISNLSDKALHLTITDCQLQNFIDLDKNCLILRPFPSKSILGNLFGNIIRVFFFIFINAYLNLYFEAKLTYFWPMSNFSEVINGRDLECETEYRNSYRFVYINSDNEAMYLNNGRLKIPIDSSYFAIHSTITAWVYFKEYNSNSRIVEFGNGQQCQYGFGNVCDSVTVYIHVDDKPKLKILNSYNYCPYHCYIDYSYYTIDYVIEIDKWYHIAYALERHPTDFTRAKAKFYINGQLQTIYGDSLSKGGFTSGRWYPVRIWEKEDDFFIVAPQLKRSRGINYVGGSSFKHDPKANAIFDDIKIFDGALDSNDVMSDFLNNYSGRRFNLIFFID